MTYLCPLCNEVNRAPGTFCTGCGLEREPKRAVKNQPPEGPLWDRHCGKAGKTAESSTADVLNA